MKKNKLLLVSAISLAACAGVVGMATLSHQVSTNFITATGSTYELVLNADNAPTSDFAHHTVTKANGATFDVTYTNCVTLPSGHVKINAGGSLLVNTKLGGLHSGKATYTGTLNAYVGLEKDDLHEASIGADILPFFDDYKFNYIKLVAETDVELTDVKFVYSCEQALPEQYVAGIATTNNPAGAKIAVPNKGFLGDEVTVAIYPAMDNEITSVKLNGEAVSVTPTSYGYSELNYKIGPNDHIEVHTTAEAHEKINANFKVIDPATGAETLVKNEDVTISIEDKFTFEVEAPMSLEYGGETYTPVKKFVKVARSKTLPTVDFYYAKVDKLTSSTEASASLAGAGTQADPYLITSAADYLYLRETVNAAGTTSGLVYKLTKIIDLDNLTGFNMSEKAAGFAGTFDGSHAGFVNYKGGEGLFGYLGNNASIKDLTIEGDVNTTAEITGIFASQSTNASFSGCAAYGSLYSTNQRTGAFVGTQNGGKLTIDGSENYASVEAVHATNGANKNGGFVGYSVGATVTNSNNFGEVIGKSSAGGVIGSCELASCVFSLQHVNNFAPVSVTYSSVNGLAGGIFGGTNKKAISITFDDCNNYGDVSTNNAAGSEAIAAGKTGGIFGGALTIGNKVTLTGCENFGDITTIQIGGGLVGYLTGQTASTCNWSITNSVNAGDVSPFVNAANTNIRDNYGGIIGYATGSGDAGQFAVGISNVLNFGDVTGSRYLGGLTGQTGAVSMDFDVDHMINFGDLTCTYQNMTKDFIGYTAGIIGWTRSKTHETLTNVINYGNITSELTYGAIGGIVGMTGGATTVTIENAVNYGWINAGGNGVGGILGGTTSATDSKLYIRSAVNEGRVYGNKNIGGIIGTVAATSYAGFEIDDACENHGKIKGNSNAGDIIGGDSRTA